jgi:outer membrane protein assembly factor BamB
MKPLSLLFAAVTVTTALQAADWPQYRGPSGDGSTPDKVASNWGAGPKVVWKVPAGSGFSSFAVAGGKCFAIEGKAAGANIEEVLVARDAATGKSLWETSLGATNYEHGGGNEGAPGNNGGDGPRSSPTVAGNLVFTVNSDLVVAAHDVAKGKLVWKRDLMSAHSGKNIKWKNAASPLLEGGLLYVGGGGEGQSFLALNPANGTVAGKSGTETITHSTPVAATILGQRQVIFFVQSGLVSLEPKTMKQLWRADFPFAVSTAMTPVAAGDIVFCSAGYNVGAGAFKISKAGAEWKAEQVMRTPGDKKIANHWSTPVLFNGHMYGMFQFKKYGQGPIKCVKLPDGDITWEKDGFGPGHVVLTAGGQVLALSDTGELVLFAAKPDAYSELGRAKILEGKCWTTPVVSNGFVFVRSAKEAACVDLRAK